MKIRIIGLLAIILLSGCDGWTKTSECSAEISKLQTERAELAEQLLSLGSVGVDKVIPAQNGFPPIVIGKNDEIYAIQSDPQTGWFLYRIREPAR